MSEQIQAQEQDWNKAFEKLFDKLYQLNMRKLYDLYFVTELSSWQVEEESLLTDAEGNKTMKLGAVSVTGWKTSLMRNKNQIHYRAVEGTGDEEKYLSLYYMYLDLLNSGLQFFYLVNQEKGKMDMELAQLTKDKFKA